MDNKNMEMMKKLIEEKKNKSAQQGLNKRPNKNMGGRASKGFSNKKQGGMFDK